jgi:hypothetical protein
LEEEAKRRAEAEERREEEAALRHQRNLEEIRNKVWLYHTNLRPNKLVGSSY